jgi:hypothetical protein
MRSMIILLLRTFENYADIVPQTLKFAIDLPAIIDFKDIRRLRLCESANRYRSGIALAARYQSLDSLEASIDVIFDNETTVQHSALLPARCLSTNCEQYIRYMSRIYLRQIMRALPSKGGVACPDHPSHGTWG